MKRSITIALFAAAVLLPITGAQAQWYSSYRQAPSAGSPDQPYAVEVAPNTYMIHRSDKKTATRVEPAASDRPRTHANRELIGELVKRKGKAAAKTTAKTAAKATVINTTKTVRGKPVVIEHERVVDDPPRVIERRHITEDAPGRGLIKQRREVATEDVVIEPGGTAPPHSKSRQFKESKEFKSRRAPREIKPTESNAKRVIRAEAEVTILGPDRMSIRLFRKGRDANAEVGE